MLRAFTSLPTDLSPRQLQCHYQKWQLYLTSFSHPGASTSTLAPACLPAFRWSAPLTHALLCCCISLLHPLVSLPPASNYENSSRSISVPPQLNSSIWWRNQLSPWYQVPLMLLQITSAMCPPDLDIPPIRSMFISTLPFSLYMPLADFLLELFQNSFLFLLYSIFYSVAFS